MELEVGQFVRTTYGIGRIVNAYIVYDDCGGLWHLSYMTDNPKIEVSIYTKNDSWELFGEVQKDHRIKYEPLENNFDLVKKVYEQELEEIVCYVPVNKKYPRNASLYDDHKFIKASYNIIDILEVGDIIKLFMEDDIDGEDTNIFELIAINYNDNEIGVFNSDFQIEFFPIENLRGILTHEQMEQMAYKVGE